MSQFLGMFYSKKPRCLQGYYDAPYLMMGRHVLCGKGYASDGGAAALAVGWMRNADALRREIRDSGMKTGDNVTLSALLLNAYRLWGEDCIRAKRRYRRIHTAWAHLSHRKLRSARKVFCSM